MSGNLKITSKDDSYLHRVSDDKGVELTLDVSWNDLEKCQAKPNSSRNLVASTIRKSAEVTLRQTIIGYHDPRVGSDVRTEAPVASRRGRSLFFMATAHIQFSIEKVDVKNAFLQERFNDKTHGELAQGPVPELRKAGNLREDEIVVLAKACHGLIDAPRRWWKSLVRHTQQLGWRSCRHEPCLMTWHVRGRLKGLVCFHVGDLEFKRMLDKVKRLYEWGEWEQHEFDQCGCRIRQAADKSVTVDQESYARKISLITMSAQRRKHMSEALSAEEHTTLMAKSGELNWSATQSMIPLLAPLSLIDTSKTARRTKSLKDVNPIVRQAHCEASGKLHCPVISDPVFVSSADASWANRKDLVLSGDISVLEQRGHCWVGAPHLVAQSLGILAGVPRVARSSRSAETQAAMQAQEETEIKRL